MAPVWFRLCLFQNENTTNYSTTDTASSSFLIVKYAVSNLHIPPFN
uniref:Uncharacterized protein n=1 Tax=Anguilla anguilla TaxID=7936 RepID=A0A0E9RUD9_ANGAN